MRVGMTKRSLHGLRRKFREGRWDGDGGLKEQLEMEKRNSQGAVYLLGCKLDTPGTYYLGYIINTNAHREYFTVTSEGFYFRHEVRIYSAALVLHIPFYCHLPLTLQQLYAALGESLSKFKNEKLSGMEDYCREGS